MRLSIIVAMAQGGVIGRGGTLPWHISADLRRFKRITMGHPIVMGRKTYDSIGRPLPGRTSIVISRQSDYKRDGVAVLHSLDAAIECCDDTDEAFVIGGAEIYRLVLPRADRLYVTRIRAQIDGDTYFPPIDWNQWRLVEEELGPADDRVPFRYVFEVYDRP